MGLVDHLYAVVKDVEYKANAEEVMAARWLDPAELSRELKERPDAYSPWFKAMARDFLLKDSVWTRICSRAPIEAVQLIYGKALS